MTLEMTIGMIGLKGEKIGNYYFHIVPLVQIFYNRAKQIFFTNKHY